MGIFDFKSVLAQPTGEILNIPVRQTIEKDYSLFVGFSLSLIVLAFILILYFIYRHKRKKSKKIKKKK
ncbi:MAG: hypothetical protein QXM68_04200 [Candidatus Aenigmatarchaeota archaeon]|nr:hypothetical protein [Candidatus Aenigmarchaeota archaeon]